MPLTQYLQKAMLDWCFGGAAVTQPGQRWISFATGTPNTSGASDGPFNTRVTVKMAAANSPQGSMTNNTAMTVATATAVATAVGFNIWDSTAGGTRLLFGTATAVIGCKSADNIQINAGSLIITIQ
jgi:hypothetical protein